MKKCRRCGKEKELDCFGNDKRGKDGKVTICKVCDSKRGCEWAKNNPEKSRKRTQSWMDKNPEKHRTMTRRYIKSNPDYLRKWRAENPEHAKATNKRTNDKKLSTPKGRLLNRISCAMRRSIRENKQGRHWEDLVGYTLQDLMTHIEKQFVDGMSWDCFHKIHIDHFYPLASFSFAKPEDEDFQKAWALSNLRPMWAKDNLSKGAKLPEQFHLTN